MSGPAAPRTLNYLAFDYGQKRVGVATGNSFTRQAQPLRTIAAEGEERFTQAGKFIREWQPDALVIGVPFHPDGQPHENTTRARKFGRQLHGRFGLPVHEVDERYSTTEAHAMGAQDLDAASAAVILQQFLNAQPPQFQP
jgi:putative Holliday junction resolvase